MRVLWFTHGGRLAGGAELSLRDTAEVFGRTDQSLELTVCAPEGGLLFEALEASSAQTHAVGACPWWALLPNGQSTDSSLWANVRKGVSALVHSRTAVKRLRQLIRQHHPDVVLTNTSVVPQAAIAAKLERVPHVWLVRELSEPCYLFGRRATLALIRRLSAAVVVNSTWMQQQARASGLHASVVLPIVTLPARDMYVAAPRDRALRILLLGRQTLHKRPDLAIRAIAIACHHGANLLLRVVGPCPHEVQEQLRTLIALYGVEDLVELVHGFVSAVEELDACDVGLLCATGEPFGRVGVELMRRGKPVVAPQGFGPSEYLVDGKNGLTFRAGDARDLSGKLMKLDRQRELVESLSRQAFLDGKNTTTAEQQVERLRRVLVNVTKMVE